MLCDDIRELTERALWECENLIRCIPEKMWERRYDGVPMWKYVYHMLYSLDRWFINPYDKSYQNPPFHKETTADLNKDDEDESLTAEQILTYFHHVSGKVSAYVTALTDEDLAQKPEGSDISRMRLILGQHRHLHRHMGIVYGFLIEDTGKWPYVLNMFGKYPEEEMPVCYE